MASNYKNKNNFRKFSNILKLLIKHNKTKPDITSLSSKKILAVQNTQSNQKKNFSFWTLDIFQRKFLVLIISFSIWRIYRIYAVPGHQKYASVLEHYYLSSSTSNAK